MPKLRYKHHDSDRKKKKKKRKHSRSRSPPRQRYRPPTLYEEEEGWIPSGQAQKDDETEWRERLFHAMAEDEGQDAFYSQYNSYNCAEPRSEVDRMTDDEYRDYIEMGMYRKRNAEKIAQKEAARAEAKRKREEAKRAQEKLREEDERNRVVQEKLLKLQNRVLSRQEYDKQWVNVETASSLRKKDIPWPVSQGQFSFQCVREFLLDPSQPSEINKKRVRKEQLRYHPDKFAHKVLRKVQATGKEYERLEQKMNEVSGWLNDLWTEMNV
ncbi:hypothetical protein DFQ28_006824 [Apophysomyces sp. BC1034]|nr:hypothetical protein DFQ30_006617 [Apophysomyces sp. BC1015]KAG0176882.1 hypothetical protein DFQ29_005537 [Apophysomyces sp. BC1021]KAG0187143.1 hypothetical protein DFQ28_006824 [Apophysomyces sp. BC1034]